MKKHRHDPVCSRVLYPNALIGAFVLLLIPLLLPAQSLDSLVNRVIETHPSVAAARLAIDQVDARARGAAAWEPPRAGVQFSMLPPSNPNPFAKGETMLMVEQMIPLFGQNSAMAQAMERGRDVGQAEVEKVQRELRGRVEREYYTLWLTGRRLRVNTESRKLADLLAKSAEVRYTTGSAGQSDLYRINIEIERLATEQHELDLERAESLARLNALLLRPLDFPIEVADTLPTTPLPLFDSLAPLLATHPTLRGMEAMSSMSNAEADAEMSMLKPMLMLGAGVAYMPEGHPLREGNASEHLLHGATSEVMHFGLAATATFTIPIAPWSRSGPEGRAEEKRLLAEQQLLERDGMRADMLAELHGAYSRAERARIRIEYYNRTQIPLLEQSIESLQGDYTAGRAAFASVIEGYTMLVMAHDDEYMKEMEYAMALSMIREMTGWGGSGR